MGEIVFSVRTINPFTCTPGSVVCSGTASLTLQGEILSPWPPFDTGDLVAVRSSAGEIVRSSGCAFPLAFVFVPGATLVLGANPSYLGDPGALFEQV